jgi:hypothetical protein
MIFFIALSERPKARVGWSLVLPVRCRMVTVRQGLVSLSPALWAA